MFEIKWRHAVAATAFVLSLTAGAGFALPAQAVAAPAAPTVPMVRVAGYNVDGLTYTKWNANRATLGNPIGSKSCDAVSCSQRFQKGSIIWTQKTGAQMVLNYAIGARYSANGWTRGSLGFPVSDEFSLTVRGGAVQKFQNGSVYWSSATGAHAVRRAIQGYFATNNYERGFLGYPRSEEVAVTNGVRQDFEGGKVYWSSATGPHAVRGAIQGYFAANNYERGFLGYPRSEEVAVANGVRQDYERGKVYWSGSSGLVFTTTGGYIQTSYENRGGAQSYLGLPTSNKTAWQGGYYQRFQGGVITWGPTTGARSIDAGHFTTLAGSFGKYGWPTRDTWKDATGTHTQFQTGIITTGAPPVTAPPVTAPPVTPAPVTPVYPFTSVEATATSVVLYGDSQLDGDSWSEQGARALGFTDQASHLSFGGMGYSTSSPWAGGTGWTALQQGLVPFPGGTPGLVLVSLGGNDATAWKSDAQVIADSSALWAKLKLMYPQSKIVINGVMSRSDASHVQRRHIDDVLAANAAAQGVTFISVAGLASTADAQYLDNVHLAQAGHDAVAALYIPKLVAALGR